MRKNLKKYKIWTASAVAIFLSLAAVYNYMYYVGSYKTVDFTISRADREIDANGQSVYKVFTDQGVFVNHDTWVYFKFNSGDIHGKLVPGRTCQAEVYGFRNRFLSMFPNIRRIECQID